MQKWVELSSYTDSQNSASSSKVIIITPSVKVEKHFVSYKFHVKDEVSKNSFTRYEFQDEAKSLFLQYCNIY